MGPQRRVVKLNRCLGAYRLEQRDVPEPVYVANNNSPYCCWTSGAGRSLGLELGLDGELARGWLVGSGYAYNLVRYIFNNGDVGTNYYPTTSSPRHLLKIWTSARLSGAFSRLTIGGSLRAQTTSAGAVFETCNPQGSYDPGPNCFQDVNTRPYAVADLRTGYQLSRNWQVALNVNNVFDKRYYLSENTPNTAFWYGEPRNFM